MKKIFLLPLVIVAVLVLSGCSAPGLPVKNDTDSSSFGGGTKKGSLWKTSDGGNSFEVKSKINEESFISKANILSIAYHPKKEKTIYVSTVNSGIFKTENAGENWEPISFPPKRIYSFIVDKNDPDNTMFASGVVGGWGKIFRTKNGGNDWQEVYTEPGEDTTVTALSQHPKNNNIIFAGTSSGTVVKSEDAGNTWKNVGSKVDGIVAFFDFDSAENLSTYLLSYGEKFYYSKDGGENWIDWEEAKKEEVKELNDRATEANRSGNRALAKTLNEESAELNKRNRENQMPKNIVSVAADSLISGTVYVGTGEGFFVSRDYGKYWYEVNIIESARQFPIRSIAVNPKNSNEIVFVSGKAFYKSLNAGETWSIVGLNADRAASFVSYDPFNSDFLFVGLRNFK